MKIRKLGDKKWKVVLFQGSPRDPDTCSGMVSKTHKIVDYVLEKWSPFIAVSYTHLTLPTNREV